MKWQKISLIVGILVGLAGLVSAGFKVDSHYAHAEDFAELARQFEYTNLRLEQKIINDDLRNYHKLLVPLELKIEDGTATVTERRKAKEIRFKMQELESEKENLKRENM
ncbi:MAG: hypothetical protein DRP56_00860 [Planctomycetota bacterium]|nr:MAG: hypothetical protein DRP56_00860 [Planctomycetota bacterium]